MRKSFMKFLPVVAAILLATSCSKDGDNDDTNVVNNSEPEAAEVVNHDGKRVVPFSVTVNTGKSLSKIAYTDTKVGDKMVVLPAFDATDANMEMVITSEDDVITGTLNLTDWESGTFSGNLTIGEGATAETDLTGTITVVASESNPNWSDDGIEALMGKCGHTYTAKFKYGTKDNVDLEDDKAYLEIFMSSFANHSIKVNETDYTVKNGRIWIAVPGGEAVKISGDDLSEITKTAEQVSSGKIYTIARHYFTVSSEGKRVYFSTGNLQYRANDDTWQFATNQWGYIGNAAGNNTATGRESSTDWIDLFGWGTWLDGASIEEPYEVQSKDATSYVWDGNSAIGADWTTLTIGEWSYLLGTNDKRNGKYGWGSIVDGGSTINGLIILPDTWMLPTGCEFTAGMSASNSYTAGENGTWIKMETAGAVFLPAAGYRGGTSVSDVGTKGWYWSSEVPDLNQAYRVNFYSGRVITSGYDYRLMGYSIRLVRCLN